MKTLSRLVAALSFACALAACDSGSSTTRATQASAPSGGLVLVEVRELVELAEDASRRNDLPAAFAFLAEDAVISSAEPGPDGKLATTTRSKAEFAQAQTEAAAQYPNSRYTSEVTDVTLAPDGASATATVRGEQTLTDNGREARASFEQVLTIQPRNGEPKIVAVKGTMTGLTIDGTKVF